MLRREEATTVTATAIPDAFLCPLTLDIMWDPVLDCEGNTYERYAIEQWLSQNRRSPLSQQPCHPKLLISNRVLRDIIHQSMGSEWVKEQQDCSETISQDYTTDNINNKHDKHDNDNTFGIRLQHQCRFRLIVDTFLEQISHQYDKLFRLNNQGVCLLHFASFHLKVEVQEISGLLFVSTFFSIFNLTNEMKDSILTLNGIHEETRGGCLSVIYGSGHLRPLLVFTYKDRIPELTFHYFQNILENFVATALKLQEKILNPLNLPYDKGQSRSHCLNGVQ